AASPASTHPPNATTIVGTLVGGSLSNSTSSIRLLLLRKRHAVCGPTAGAGGGARGRTPQPAAPACGRRQSASLVETGRASCCASPAQQTAVTQNPLRRGTRTRCITRRKQSTYQGCESTSFVPAREPEDSLWGPGC